MTSRAAPLLILAAVLLLPRTALAWPPSPVKLKIAIPFSGSVFHPATNEYVSVAGSLAVKTAVQFPVSPIAPPNPIVPPSPVKIQNAYRLDKNVTAIGQTTSGVYKLKGSNTIKYFVPSDPIYPANPVRTLTQRAVFAMVPINPIFPGDPIKSVRVLYQLDFDDGGQLTSAQAIVEPDPAADSCVPVAAVCASPQPALTPAPTATP